MGKGGQPQLLLELPAPTILVIKGRLGGWGGVEHGTKLRLGYTENKLTCLLGIVFCWPGHFGEEEPWHICFQFFFQCHFGGNLQ